MLLSMTGHGIGESHNADLAVSVELKTINNRYFKVSVRSNENSLSIEPKLENLLKTQIRRGTVQANLRIERRLNPDQYKLNLPLLDNYLHQLVSHKLIAAGTTLSSAEIAPLLSLPGVVQEPLNDTNDDSDWPVIEQAAKRALENLQVMREQEGQSMAADLTANCQLIGEFADQIQKFAPKVIEAYEQRLIERLRQLLEKHGVDAGQVEIIREVGLFADRCDISEELVRLRSHLQQFAQILDDSQSNGRKLDFLTQELFREVNTIGSKANDAEIARHVVEIKTIVERIREMVQNAE